MADLFVYVDGDISFVYNKFSVLPASISCQYTAVQVSWYLIGFGLVIILPRSTIEAANHMLVPGIMGYVFAKVEIRKFKIVQVKMHGNHGRCSKIRECKVILLRCG